MNRWFSFLLILACLASACSPASRSQKSYDEIRRTVAGKTASEVEKLLGPPDTREDLLLGDERWIWWNYTYLGGDGYPPEMRGRVVHLEITFENPAVENGRQVWQEWRVSQPYGVGFRNPILP